MERIGSHIVLEDIKLGTSILQMNLVLFFNSYFLIYYISILLSGVHRTCIYSRDETWKDEKKKS